MECGTSGNTISQKNSSNLLVLDIRVTPFHMIPLYFSPVHSLEDGKELFASLQFSFQVRINLVL
uniref:Uncharacterized protein n=1 Tax=Lepeophtheirus salmonis TaxID=72036 RepID=A0A0K2V2M9_LEPSM